MRTTHQIQTFRIGRAMLEKPVERHARIFKLVGRDVRRCDFSPDLVLRMCRILRDNVFEVLNRVSVSPLLSSDTSELITRVDFAIVDLQRALKPFTRCLQLAAALMNQPEVVVRGSVRGIESR